MQSAYRAVAAVLVNIFPGNFEQARITGALQAGRSSIQYWCDRAGETIEPDIETTQHLKVDDTLHNLRSAMTRPGQQPWSCCAFTLYSDGRFNFDVEYDG